MCIRDRTKTSLISEENIVNNSTQISYFLILNDKTFQELKNSLGPDYQFRYYLFNGDHPENSKAFQDDLLGKIVTLNNGEIFDSYQEAAVQDKICLLYTSPRLVVFRSLF